MPIRSFTLSRCLVYSLSIIPLTVIALPKLDQLRKQFPDMYKK